jgi:hypothetical protein
LTAVEYARQSLEQVGGEIACSTSAEVCEQMPRNLYPRSIEELEHDDAVYGPADPREEYRMLLELNWAYLAKAAERIASSRALLAKVAATFPRGRGA